jgi:hypothetical protein
LEDERNLWIGLVILLILGYTDILYFLYNMGLGTFGDLLYFIIAFGLGFFTVSVTLRYFARTGKADHAKIGLIVSAIVLISYARVPEVSIMITKLFLGAVGVYFAIKSNKNEFDALMNPGK